MAMVVKLNRSTRGVKEAANVSKDALFKPFRKIWLKEMDSAPRMIFVEEAMSVLNVNDSIPFA